MMGRGKVLLGMLMVLGAMLSARAQQPTTNVLDWKAPTTLSTYLLQRLHEQYAPRAAQLDYAAQSAANAMAYRDSVRARFRRVLGPLPTTRTPLRAQVTGQLARAGFRIEKVIYESTPNHHVTANLYVPAGAGRWPAVLFPCGHEAEGKATVSYQQTAMLFALNGFAVLVPDPVSQGERMQLTDAAGKPLTRGGTTEHTLLNAQAALVGRTLPAAELWDNVRSLDYLASRPEVDTARLGCLGNSGGATQTAYLMAFDPRLKAAALCSYVAAGERNLELTGPADGCVMLPGAGRARLDLADWPIMFAPKPLRILAGRYDFVDYTQIQAVQAEALRVYMALGKFERISMFTYDDGHGISKPKRADAVVWFRRWLGEAAGEPVVEGNLPVSTAKELQCTATGQVNTSFAKEENLSAFYQAEAKRLAKSRPAFESTETHSALTWPLGWDVVTRYHPLIYPKRPSTFVRAEARDTLRRTGLALQKLILRGDTHLPLPALLLTSDQLPDAERRTLICFSDRGKAALADSTAWLRSLQSQYTTVLLVDLRGHGETADPAAALDPKYYNREYRPALIGLHLGQSLLAQRVEDVYMLLQYCTVTRRASGPVDLYADGRTSALVALHAAVLAPGPGPGIQQVKLRALPASYQSQLATPTARDTYSDALPGVLRYYDVPDLVRALGQRLVLARP
ncbi:acetylxylan esterase [Hymenobacter sp. M29]|uniref:Acetylxylan esterase n=1 Tax=Hymenobacter mellowenesis TaxID=3063995 RepID=A0ABT9AEL5_9BACT|nr:acetylxylan esterase [Hymenobacter sp. M29]MDO7848294.1 acetylxylan esterase [Hymenobacter sp. M29]